MLQESTTDLSLPDMSEAKRALLQKYLGGGLELSPPESWAIARRAPEAPALPSLGQEQLWIHAQLAADLLIYNEPVTVRRTGPLDLAALKQSLNEIIRRHEAWRTNFAIQDGQLVQVINPVLDLQLPLIDLRALDKLEREAEALRLATQDARRPFDLSEGPLLRVMLVRLTDDEHRLYLTLHQIIFDGVSLYSVFMPELVTLYEAFVNGQRSPLPEPPIQYADFSHWQRQQAEGEACAKELVYWRKQLAGAPAALELPTDQPRPLIQTFRGSQLSFKFSRELSDALKACSRREGTTLFMTLLAGFQTMLHRYTDQDDLVVGTVTTSRKRPEFDELLGFFLNTLVLRTDLSGDPTFSELLGRVRKVTVDALAHGDVPFHRLVKELEHERDPSRNPFFQVMFVLEPPLPELPAGWDLSQVNVDAGIARVDLYLELDDRSEGLVGRFRYNRDLFADASITRMVEQLRTLLEGVAANPDRAIADYPLRTGQETANDLVRGDGVRPHNSFTPFAKSEIEQSIGERFESQVRKYPANIAVKSRTHEWSYVELNDRANRIAQGIFASRGAEGGQVALLFEHDAPMIAAMLGALKAGKTYVPLDPNYPEERLAYIIEHSQASVLLTNNANMPLARRLNASGVRVINIDRLNSEDRQFELPVVSADKLAYLLYTSGSTGQPKGVMQNHRNVLHFIRVYTNNLHINSDDRLTLLSSYCFDASVMDIYGALLNGATLHPINIKQDGLTQLADQLSRQQITVYHSTPTVYRYFVDTLDQARELSNLRLIVLGGEEVTRRDVDLYRKYFPDNCLFVNGLGPTESTVSLQNFIDKQTAIAAESVPVGFPVEDTEILLLNKAGRPRSIRGEIAIKSEHVALGYWRNAETTAAAFSRNGSSARIYRTGDMGRRLADGSIRFEGRKDFQVKIRGFRVELGEIESVLTQHPSISECVVVARETNDRDKQLIAYLIPKTNLAASESELLNFLRQRLPDYMLPAAFVKLESLPLTASGKVNRPALPAPAIGETRSLLTTTAPQTALEKLLLPIWSDVLGVPIGIHDNFFECGGHSLMAVRLFAQIEKRFGRRWPLATLFQLPTIAQFAATIEKDWSPKWSSLVAIKPDGSKPPFFCVHGLGGNVLEFSDLARHLDDDQPFYGLQSQGLDGKQPLLSSVEDMAAHYVKEMRELQPMGPYFIGGRSLGGAIAFEMARQLRAEGHEIALLALLDTYPAQAAQLARRFAGHATNLRSLSFSQRFGYLARKARFAPRKIKGRVWRTIYDSLQKSGRTLPRVLESVTEFNSLAAHRYLPQAYDGRVTLFWARDDLRASNNFVAGWRALAMGGIEVQEIPGTHLNIIKEPHVGVLAKKLNDCLQRAQDNSGAVARP